MNKSAFLRATGTHPALFATGIADVSAGRPGSAARRGAGPVKNRAGRPTGPRRGGSRSAPPSLNPFRGYATALARYLPAAIRAPGPFHVTRLGLGSDCPL